VSSLIFSTFSVILLVLGRPERSSSTTDIRPTLKRECHTKTSKSLRKHFKGFGRGFTELHAKLDADTLLDFTIHRRQNETRSRKSTRVKAVLVHSAVSRGRLMQQACGSVTLTSLLIFFH
jgi:hypothetical protein